MGHPGFGKEKAKSGGVEAESPVDNKFLLFLLKKRSFYQTCLSEKDILVHLFRWGGMLCSLHEQKFLLKI